MAVLLPNSLIDGGTSWEMGVDTYRAPSRVPRNQLCLSVNNSTRQDFIGPRPRWKQIPVKFYTQSDGQFTPDVVSQTNFETGMFQGAAGYVPDSGPSHIVFGISGLLFRVNAFQGGQGVALLMPEARPNDKPIQYFQQAEQFLIVQDGQSTPLIYDGQSVRLSNLAGTGGTDADHHPWTEVPVGTVMAYSGGRLWVTLPNQTSFVAGDGVYGPTGTPTYQMRDSVLRFTENQYINEGFAFAVPSNMSPIRAMVSLANLDTSLGQGSLQVFTPTGCFSVNAPFDRTEWKNLTYPIKTVSLIDQGSLSYRATQLVNGDAWYRAQDGFRSFLIARRDFGTWGNRAMSYEVIRHLKDDDQNLLQFSSAAVFDNRLLATCTPQFDPIHGVYHRGLVALDFIPLTSIAGPQPPCWDGLWTGLDILQIFTVQSEGVTHCMAAVLALADGSGIRRIQLWELQRDTGPDLKVAGIELRTARAIETPLLDFSTSGSNRLEQKLLEAADIWIDKVSGLVDFTLSYRPDEHPCWFFWKHWQVCAKVKTCASDSVHGCAVDLNKREQYRPRIGALRPSDGVVSYTGQPSRNGYAFQFRLEIVGDAEVTAMRFLSNRIIEAVFGADLPEEASCTEFVACCELNNFLADVDDSAGGGSGGGGSGGDTPIPPPPPPVPVPPPDGGYPYVNGWTSAWQFLWPSGYGILKVTDDIVADGMTAAKAAFWQQLLSNEMTLAGVVFTNRMFCWYWVDPYTSDYGDFNAKFATGNPNPNAPDEPPLIPLGALWALAAVYNQ